MTSARRDALVAVALVLAAEAELHGRHPVSMVLALALGMVALAARRPLPVLVGVAVVLWVDALAGGGLVADGVTALVAVAWLAFVAGSRVPPLRLGLGVLGAVALLSVANQVSASAQFSLVNDGVFFAVVVAGPALAGWLTGSRARQVEELGRRNRDLELRRATLVQVARADEVERVERQVDAALAQRLHTIIDDARTAGRLSVQAPEEVPRQLARVEATARDALSDLREVLGVLQPQPQSQPQPTGAGGPRPAGAAGSGRAHPLDLVDLALVLSLVPLAVETSVSATHGLVWLDLLACAAQGVLLVVVRRRPLVGSAALFAAACLQSATLTSLPQTVSWLVPGLLVALMLGSRVAWRFAWSGLVLLVAGVGSVELATPPGQRSLGGLLPTAALAALAWWAGRTVAVRERRAAELTALAEELARTRDEQVRVAAAEQRADMVRELHDIGAHALTVVCLQAGAAQTLWTRDRDQARGALQVVLELANDSLAHLRESLTGLVAEESAAPLDVAALEVLAGIGRVLGLQVGIGVYGTPRPLPPVVARAAFRVVQESLTNSARHAAYSRVEIGLAYSSNCVEVWISDSGPGPARTGPADAVNGAGVGLRGMRERVEACHGELTCGPCDGGFAVRARLPLRAPVLVPA